MPKCLKLLTFLILSLFLGQSSFAWEELLEFKGDNYKGKVEYDSEQKAVRLKYKRKGNWGRYTVEGPLNLSTPTAVVQSLNHLSEMMKRLVFTKTTQNQILGRIEEFKFLSNQECQALHFSLNSFQGENAINDLIQEVEKIRLAQNPGTEAHRSLLIREFETQTEGTLQLRMVLDRNGEFLKFSFAKEEGNLAHLNWIQREGKVILLNPNGQTVLELDLRSFQKEGGLVVVRHPKENGLENNERSYFRLQKSNEQDRMWDFFPYTTQHFSETVIKDGVALTSGTAEHTPVIQLNGSEIAFPRLNVSRIREHELFSELEPSIMRSVESRYNRCMGERISFIFEEERLGHGRGGGEDADQEVICERSAELEALLLLLEKNAMDAGLGEEEKSLLKGGLQVCLEEKSVASTQGDFFSLEANNLLGKTAEDFKGIVDDCYFTGKRTIVSEVVSNRLEANSIIKDQLSNPRTRTLLEQTVVNRLKENCLDRIPGEKIDSCLDYADILIDENLFLAQVSLHLSHLYDGDRDKYGQKRLEVVNLYSTCREENEARLTTLLRTGSLGEEELSQIKGKEIDCAQKATLSLATMNSQKTFEDALTRMGLESNQSYFEAEDNKAVAVNALSECMQERMNDEESLSNLMQKVSFFQEACVTKALGHFAKTKLLSNFNSLSDEYSFLATPEEKAELQTRAEGLIERELSSWEEPEGFSQISEELQVPFYSLILTDHINQVEEKLSSESQGELEKTLNSLLSDNSRRPLSLKIKKYFEQALQSGQRGERAPEDYLKVSLKDFLKEVHRATMPLITRQEISEEVLLESDIDTLSQLVNDESESCWNHFSPNRNYSFQRHYLRCEKIRLRKAALQLFRRKSERRVSSIFRLTSAKANKILTPVNYLDTCFEKVDPYNNKTLEEYKRLIEGCQRVAELDISYNISNAKIDGYRPLLSRRGYHDAVTAYCYNIIFHHLSDGVSRIPRRGQHDGAYRDLTKMQQTQRARTPYDGSLLRYVINSNLIEPEFAENDQRHIFGLVETFAANDSFNEEWWGEKLAHCEKGTDDFINVGFREYIIESIPALSFSDANDPNSKLMRDFLDFELVESLLQYKKAFEERHGNNVIDLGNVVPSQRTLHPELGVTAMTNFIDILGNYLSKGFIYDEEAMRTELVVFQSELKSFLKWSKDNPERMTINEAMEFFQESKLAEHLALAVVSETTYNKFSRGIGAMKEEELEKLFDEANCRYVSCLSRSEKEKRNAIIAKYDRLLSLSREMTASYDFRRIISPESDDGKEIIDAIKENILMPRILGQNVTAQAEGEVMRLVGQAILEDNTDGGFAERFVEEAAQFALTEESNRRWGITKFFFFDKHDFDWETLKKTEAGERAIKYYSRYIMLPRFLGEEQSDYLKRTRLEQFRRLLTTAQGQNDD